MNGRDYEHRLLVLLCLSRVFSESSYGFLQSGVEM
jgi:hypothetical protein